MSSVGFRDPFGAAAAAAEAELHNRKPAQAVAKDLSSQKARQTHGAQAKHKQKPSLYLYLMLCHDTNL